MDKKNFRVIEQKPCFFEFIFIKTKEKLEDDREYKELVRHFNEANILYELGFKFYSKSFEDEQVVSEADIAQMKSEIEEFEEKKAKLEEKLAKAKLFKKRLRNKLFLLEKNNHVNKSYLEKIEKYQTFMKEIGETSVGAIGEKIEAFERAAIKAVIIDNYEIAPIQILIEKSLKEDEEFFQELNDRQMLKFAMLAMDLLAENTGGLAWEEDGINKKNLIKAVKTRLLK